MRSIFITGADSGLGFSLSQVFHAEGWRVFAGQLSPGSPVEAWEDEHSPTATCIPLDVRNLESVRRAAAMVQAFTPSLDVLINNAGINPAKFASLEEVDFGLVHDALDVNAVGPLRVTQQFLPLILAGATKRIANISSEAGSITNCHRDAWFGYAMSKASLNMQTRTLRNYLGPKGVDVCAIDPGWMRSGMGASDASYSTDEIAARLFSLVLERANTDTDWYYHSDGKPLPC